MSGEAPDRKRKRKRKTRAERNQMSRNHHVQDTLDTDHQKKNSKNKKASETHPPQNPTTYTLRSGKGGALPCLVPKDYVKATAGTITQGRLTRTLGLFSSSRSSEWAKREPETEEMKKKVESDLKRVLNLSGKNSHNNGDVGNVKTSTSNSESRLDHHSPSIADTQPDVNIEVDATVPRSPNIIETSEPSTKNFSNEKDSNSITTHGSGGTGIATALSEISRSPECPGEVLDPVPPIQDIADKIMKELKPKFDKLFPNRDIEMEICCDLQKLLKQSVCQREEPRNDSCLKQTHLYPGDDAPGTRDDAPDTRDDAPGTRDDAPGTPDSVLQPSLKSKLSANRSFQSSREVRRHVLGSSNSDSSPRSIIWESAPFQVRIQDLTEKKEIKTCLSQSFLLSDVAEDDKMMRINMKQDESQSSDGEDDSGFSIVRYNEFVASARQLEVEVERQRLTQLNSESQQLRRHSSRPADDQVYSCNSKSLAKSSDWRVPQAARALDFADPKGVFGGVTPYHCSSAHHQACSFPHDDSFGYKSKNVSSQNWRCYNAARVLDFSEAKGYSQRHLPMSCPTNSVSQNLFGDHRQSHSQHRPALSSCTSHKLPHNPCAEKNIFSKTLDKTIRGPFMSPSGYIKERDDICQVGPSLARSRYNFEEALSSACHKSDEKQAKGSCQSFMAHEKMDWQNCQGSTVSFPDKRSCGSESNSFNTWQLLTRPLSELQTHQADLQKQAKEFLDDLDRTTINHLSDRGTRNHLSDRDTISHLSDLPGHRSKHSKHLFRRGSPDSNGSPVWISSCAMKDVGLETASFM